MDTFSVYVMFMLCLCLVYTQHVHKKCSVNSPLVLVFKEMLEEGALKDCKSNCEIRRYIVK